MFIAGLPPHLFSSSDLFLGVCGGDVANRFQKQNPQMLADLENSVLLFQVPNGDGWECIAFKFPLKIVLG